MAEQGDEIRLASRGDVDSALASHDRAARALLIVNADDFGISEGVNHGIVEAHQRGIVTSTTAMANMPAFDHAVGLARENHALGVGIHLNITSGTPLLPASEIPELIGAQGRFHSLTIVLRQLTLGRLDPRQIEAELSAQVERVLSAGIAPTHLDSHHHVHMHPAIQPIAIRLARRYDIKALRCTAELGLRETISRAGMALDGDSGDEPTLVEQVPVADGTIRISPPHEAGKPSDLVSDVDLEPSNLEGRSPEPDTPRELYLKTAMLSLLGVMLRGRAHRLGLVVPGHFRGLLLGPAFSPGELQSVLRQLPSGSTELMCHPGHPDEALRSRTSYAKGREAELAALLDPANRTALSESGARLGTFADLYG